MKTMEQFWSEVKSDKELEQKLKAVKDEQELAEFLKTNGVEGTIEQFRELVEKERASGEIPDEELDTVAGGSWDDVLDTIKAIGAILSSDLVCKINPSESGDHIAEKTISRRKERCII